MNVNEIKHEVKTSFDNLLEGVTDLPDDASVEEQIEILTQRLEAAKKAMGIINKLKDPMQKKKHRGRVMGFMNQLRPMLKKIIKKIENDQETEPEVQKLVPRITGKGALRNQNA